MSHSNDLGSSNNREKMENNSNTYINLTEQTMAKTLDAIKENMIKSIDEYVKIQPRFLQSMSDFQLDAIQAAKDTINKTISHQKRFIREFVNVSQSQPNETYQQLFKKSSENIDNFVNAFNAGNNYNFDTIDNTRENLKIYTKAIDAYNDYSTNTFNAWISFAKSFSNNS